MNRSNFSMTRVIYVSLAVLLGLAAVVFVRPNPLYTWFVGNPRPVDDTKALAAGDRAECPHDWNKYFSTRPVSSALQTTRPGRSFPATLTASVSTYMISGEITNVPEFHDCQRLIWEVSGERTYAQLAAIFASDHTDSVVASSGPFVVAEVFSEGAYPSLGIHAGFHCLIVDPDSAAATMVFLGASQDVPSCRTLNPDSLPTGMLKEPLLLQLDLPVKFAVPPVARWEWDNSTGQQIIGIKCRPTQWCTVGPTGFVAPLVVAGASQVMQVPGWYDDQYIADYPTSGIEPGNAFGRAFPAENLGEFTSASQFSEWTLVAHIEMPAGFPTDYKTKLGFEATGAATTGLDGLNQLFFCYGASSDCEVPVADLAVKNGGCTVASWTGRSWWGKVVSASGAKPLYHCVAFRQHGPLTTVNAMGEPVRFEMPGIVRWRWRADDETIWVRCPLGCCEVHAGL